MANRTCDICNYTFKFPCTYRDHLTTKKHIRRLNNDISPYICVPCDQKYKYKCQYLKHIQTVRHNYYTNPPLPKLLQCNLCHYKTYQIFYFQRHKRRHRDVDYGIKKTLFKSKMEEQDKEDEKIRNKLIMSVDKLKEDINNILLIYRERKKDPNDYFNYIYYAQNIDKFNIKELNDFYDELKYSLDF